MASRMYMVAVDLDATAQQRDAFTRHLREMSVGFWHHIATFWIVSDSMGRTTVTQLRDTLKEMMPGVNTMVVQVSPHTWAGVAPTVGHQWLQQNLSEKKHRWTAEKE